MKRLVLALLIILPLLLASCSGETSAPQLSLTQAVENTQSDPAPVQTAVSTLSPVNEASTSGDMTRTDEQGAVAVTVTPLNLGESSEQLEFDIALETHSVDLSMDLAMLSSLTTDTGVTIKAILWDAPRGGHHVSGKLIFPALSDGKSILEGTRQLTLTILNVDAASRVFEWHLK